MQIKNIIKNKYRLAFEQPQQRLTTLLHESKSPLTRQEEARLLAAVREMSATKQPWEIAGKSALNRLGLGVSTAQAALTLAQNWPRLTKNVRQVVGTSIPAPLSSAVQTLLTSSIAQDRIAAAQVIADRPTALGTAGLARLLTDSTPQVRQAAIVAMASCITSAHETPALERAIDHALASMVERFDTLPDRSVIAVALSCLPRPDTELARIIADDGHPALMVWRSQIRKRQGDLPAAQLVRLLSVDALAPAALDALCDLKNAADVVEFARSSHFLLTPKRRQRLVKANTGRRLLAKPSALSAAASQGGMDLPRAIELLGGFEDAHASQRFSQWIESKDDAVHIALILRLARTPRPNPAASDALRDLSFNANPLVARSALLTIVDDHHPQSRRLLDKQRRSPHPTCRAVAQERWRRRDPAWALSTDDPLADAVALRKAMSHDRASVIALLRTTIGADNTPAAVRAMRQAARIGVAPECELELLAAIATRNEKVAATAVSILAFVQSDSATQTLNACLSHPDARVRANAVEAVNRRTRAVAPDSAWQSDAARERCNAVRTLFDRTEPKLRAQGLVLLDSMLKDDRPAHRRSALWLAGRIGAAQSAHRIASIASSDADPAVRAAARRTARQLLARMRAATPVDLVSRATAISA